MLVELISSGALLRERIDSSSSLTSQLALFAFSGISIPSFKRSVEPAARVSFSTPISFMLVIISATWIVQLIHFVTLLLIDNSKRPTRVYFDLIFENSSRLSVCLCVFSFQWRWACPFDLWYVSTINCWVINNDNFLSEGETSRSGLMIRSISNFSQASTGKDNQSFTSAKEEDNPRWKHKVPTSSWRDSRFTFERCGDDGYLCRLSGCISTREFEFISIKTNELERRGDLQETKSESMFLPSLPNEKWPMNTCSVAIFSLSRDRERERERIREMAWHFIEVSIDPVSGHWPGRMLLSSIGISSFPSVLDDRQSLDWTSTSWPTLLFSRHFGLLFNPSMAFLLSILFD